MNTGEKATNCIQRQVLAMWRMIRVLAESQGLRLPPALQLEERSRARSFRPGSSRSHDIGFVFRARCSVLSACLKGSCAIKVGLVEKCQDGSPGRSVP